jgi:autotransporter-associated beta strand protein
MHFAGKWTALTMRHAAGFVVLCAAILLTKVADAQVVTINQSFNGTTAPGWVLGGTGYTPVLTAAQGIDPTGSGWLRLTSNGGNEATYAYDSTAFNAANATIAVQFSYASYNGTGADGITFFLANANAPGGFSVGAYGGSLGYAQKTAAGGGGADINGMNGGYIGLGIDEYGNYSNPTEGRIGGKGSVPNAIAVRGPGQGLTGYNYLGGTSSLATPLSFPSSTTRPTGANTRNVEIIITATNQMTVYLQAGTGAAYVPLYTIDLSGYARPDQLIMGFTGSTGGSTDIHEIQNVSLSSVAANLWTNAAGTNTWGTTSANWNGTMAPATGADILLDNTYVNSAQTIDVGQNRIVRSVQIDAPFSYTLNNGSLEFNNEGILGPSGILVSQTHGAAAQTINSNLVADNAIEIKNGTTAGLSLTGTLATNGNTVTVDGSGSTTLSGVISGAGSIVKNDAGNATLSGANTYTGGTTLNTGMLTADNNSALGTGALTVNGGTLASDNNNTVGNAITLQGNAGLSNITTSGTLTQTGGSYTVTMSNATQSGAVKLSEGNTGRTLTTEVDSGTSTISGVISNGGTGAGNLAKTGGGTLALSGANTYSGATTISAGTLQLGANNALSSASTLNLAGGTLNLNGFSDTVGALSFSNGAVIDFGSGTASNTLVFGNVSSYSGILTINNWVSGSDVFATTQSGLAAAVLNSIYFSGYGSGSVEATTLVNAGNGEGTAYFITPNSTFLTWNGSGTTNNWSTGANWVGGTAPSTSTASVQKIDFTGSTRTGPVMNGNYYVNSLKFDSAASSFNISASGYTLTLQGTLPSIIQQSSNNQTISAGTVALGANSVIDVSGAGSLTITSTISGAYGITKLSNGTLFLSGNNSFSGGLNVTGGIVSASTNNSAFGTGAITVGSGASVQVTGNRTITNSMSITGTGYGGMGAIDLNPGSSSSATLSGAITLAGDSTITVDSGTVTLSGGITGTTANLTLAGAGNTNLTAAIGTGTGGVTLNQTGTVTMSGAANTYTGNTTVNSGTLNLSKAANTTAIAGNLTVNGGTVNENASGQIASTSTLTVNGGTFALTGGSSNTLSTVNSATGSTISLSSGSTLTINGAGNSTINGGITGAGALNTQGTGGVTLANNNTYSGGSTLASVVTALNSGSLGTGAVTVNSGGNLQVQGGINLANNFTLNSSGTTANDGAIENVAGSNAISGTVTLAGNSRIQSDSGTLALSSGVNLGANTLNVGGAGNTSASGVISGTGGLSKDGAGSLTLTAANTYSGATAVNVGALNVGAKNALSSSTAVTVASGATLNLNNYTDTIGSIAGSGTLNIGSGTLIAGADNTSTTFSGSFVNGTAGTFEKTGTGTLTLGAGMNYSTGSLVLNGGTLNLGGFTSTFSSLTVTANSTLDFSGTSILNLNSVVVAAGVTLTITDWANTVDYFYSVNNPGATNLGNIVFSGYTASNTKWQSFDQEITPVPEPSTYGAVFMLLGLSACAWWRRRHLEASRPCPGQETPEARAGNI